MDTNNPLALQRAVDTFISNFDASPFTVRAYRTALYRFLAYGLPLDNDVLCAFSSCLRTDTHRITVTGRTAEGDGYQESTRRSYLVALRVFLTWLEARDQLPAGFSTVKAIARFKTGQSHRRRNRYTAKIPDRNLEALLSYYRPSDDQTPCERLETLRNNAIVQTFFSTACRVREVASLTREMVDDGYAEEVVIMGKGEKQRTIFLTPECLAAIREYLDARDDQYPALFISHRKHTGRALWVSSIFRVIKLAGRALGLKANTSPHMIRHYVATDMLNDGGVPMEVVQEFLGHDSIETTQTCYAHVYTKTLRAHVRAYAEARRGNRSETGRAA